MSYSEFDASQETRKIGFSFHGTGKEFFGIWIVNILLSIVTLGIYSAWAKVRTKRYFNGNTELDGHRFDYHANPMSILKGRIIVVVVLIAINFLSQLNIYLAGVILVFYLFALPWVIVRGISFNANMTSYRSVRFHFKSTKWQAFKAFIMWPFLGFFSLGILVPFASRAKARFLGSGHFYGQSRFSANPSLAPYYLAILISIGITLVGGLVTFVFFSIVPNVNIDTFFLKLQGPTTLYLFLGIAFLFYAARARNINFNALSLNKAHQFSSTISARRYIWIVVTNAILSIISIGLYIPWAKVRLAQYLAENTTVIVTGDLDQFTADQTNDTGVTSGEFLDIEGYDFGF